MAIEDFLFTSESVSEGHPDKVCDQTSDAVLDAYLGVDKKARVACETLVTTDRIVVAGEVTAAGFEGVDVEALARKVSREIGYTHDDIGFNADTAEVKVYLHPQSPDISQGVTAGEGLDTGQGAGDQGLMFGYACNETEELMPMPIMVSHKLVQNLASLRKSGELSFLRPDSKSQVSVVYEKGKPVKIDSLVISTQHSPDVSYDELKEAVIEQCVKKTVDNSLLKDTVYHINPTGQFIIGGPHGDCGLTGRKIIVDTYGGYARHGGGAFSGKDPSKVDRSAAYMGRYIAKNVVAAGLAEKCEVQLAYAIGVSQPVSVLVDCFGTETVPNAEIEKRIQNNFRIDPAGIVETLGLLNGIKYQPTAAYGHFGRPEFPWEKTNKADALKS